MTFSIKIFSVQFALMPSLVGDMPTTYLGIHREDRPKLDVMNMCCNGYLTPSRLQRDQKMFSLDLYTVLLFVLCFYFHKTIINLVYGCISNLIRFYTILYHIHITQKLVAAPRPNNSSLFTWLLLGHSKVILVGLNLFLDPNTAAIDTY